MSSNKHETTYTDRRNQIAKLVVKRITSVYSKAERGDSASKGQLAALRRALFSPYAANPAIWDLTYVPENLLPQHRSERLSVEEKVVHSSLGLFARHQQSKSRFMHKEGVSFAHAAHQLAFKSGDTEAAGVRRRLNATVTSVSFEEFVRHISALTTMMRSAELGFDYYKLAQDLFDYGTGIGRNRVRSSWSRDYFSSKTDKSTTLSNEK